MESERTNPLQAAVDRELRSLTRKEEPARHGGKIFVAALLAWLVPGLGHLFLGKWKKAILYFVLLNGCLVYGGTAMGYTEAGEEEGRATVDVRFKNVSPSYPFHYAAQMGLGVPVMAIGAANGKTPVEQAREIEGIPRFEIATLYIDIAGLLNYLIAMHLLLMTEVLRRKQAEEQKVDHLIAGVFAPLPADTVAPNAGSPETRPNDAPGGRV